MKNSRMIGSLAVSVACALTHFGSHEACAGGAEFGINADVQAFSLIPTPPDATYGAASGQSGVWNIIYPTASTRSLINLDGGASGVTVRQTLGGSTTSSHCLSGFLPLHWSRLMCDQQSAVAGVVNAFEYEFAGLPAGTYDLYTYACAPGVTFQPGFAVGVYVDNVYTGTQFITGPVTTTAFSPGNTHDLRTIVVEPGDDVRVRVFDTSGEFGDSIYLNGFQFVKQPDLNGSITGPNAYACVCDPVQITGTAAGAGFSSYTLEYSMSGNDPWTEIVSSNVPVNNGVLGTWDAMGLAEGYYNIRLTVQTGDGQSTTAIRTVYLNQAFDPVDLRAPVLDGVYGGLVCLDGTVWDQCFTRYTAEVETVGGDIDVDPGMPFYFSTVINDPIAGWDTTGFPDGLYTLKVTGFNTCGDTSEASVRIEVDNTLPTAIITSPQECSSFCDVLEIRGTAFDENMASWVLQYAGEDTNNWVTISSGTNNVIDDVLGVWDASKLPDCCYAIRLIVTDAADVNCGSARNRTEYVTTVQLGSPFDTNGDGVINSADLAALLAAWGVTCP